MASDLLFCHQGRPEIVCLSLKKDAFVQKYLQITKKNWNISFMRLKLRRRGVRWDEKSQFLNGSNGIRPCRFIGATEKADRLWDAGLDDMSRPCCRHTLTRSCWQDLWTRRISRKEESGPSLGDEAVTHDRHKGKDQELFVLLFHMGGGRESCKYVSLKTKQVYFSSDAFRSGSTRGESGDEHEHDDDDDDDGASAFLTVLAGRDITDAAMFVSSTSTPIPAHPANHGCAFPTVPLPSFFFVFFLAAT